MRIILLTGPAASGKNTISHIAAKKKKRCAVIDVDKIREMLLQLHTAPWDGEEGKQQQKLGVENACLLAKNFLKNDCDVILLDVVDNETAELYKQYIPQIKIVLLLPSFKEAHRRFAERPHTISEEEFKMVYTWEEKLTVYDEKIDNSEISAEQMADKLNLIL